MRERIRVEGPTPELEALRRELIDEVDDDSVTVEPVSTSIPGELREPVVVALIVAFASTASVAVKTIGSVLERRMLHVERMEGLRIFRERDEREISASELTDERPKPAIAMIDVSQDLLDSCSLEEVVGLFAEAESSPGVARMIQGRMALRFPGQEDREFEVFDDPLVRAWTRALFERIPHVLYFLDPEPAFGAIILVLCAFLGPSITVDEEGRPSTGDLGRALTVLSEHLVPVALYAESKAEDWQSILIALGEGLKPEIAAAMIHTVEASLRLGDDSPGAAV